MFMHPDSRCLFPMSQRPLSPPPSFSPPVSFNLIQLAQVKTPIKNIAPEAQVGQITASGGEMAEWFKAHAWKACVLKRYREFESPSLRHFP
jgi:hypothetical protein